MLFENVSYKGKLSCHLIMHQSYQRLISGISHTNLRHISRVYYAFLSHILGMNKACLRNILNISQIFIGHITYFENLSDIPQAYLIHYSDITRIIVYLLKIFFQLIPSLLTYNYSFKTLRSLQLIQVPACLRLKLFEYKKMCQVMHKFKGVWPI